MTIYTLQREELLALFAKVGVSIAPGVADDFLAPMADGEKATGRDFSSEEITLAELMSHPHRVVRVTRRDVNQDIQADAYYFVTGTHFAVLIATKDDYTLSALDSLETVLNDAGNMLPLRANPDSVQARALLNLYDFIEVRSLLADWDKVSAEAILEADGMKTFEAIDLAQSVESQEWNGLISFLFFNEDKLVRERTLWAVQGPDTSWLGYLDLESGKMVVQSANNEILSNISLLIWEALDES